MLSDINNMFLTSELGGPENKSQKEWFFLLESFWLSKTKDFMLIGGRHWTSCWGISLGFSKGQCCCWGKSLSFGCWWQLPFIFSALRHKQWWRHEVSRWYVTHPSESIPAVCVGDSRLHSISESYVGACSCKQQVSSNDNTHKNAVFKLSTSPQRSKSVQTERRSTVG